MAGRKPTKMTSAVIAVVTAIIVSTFALVMVAARGDAAQDKPAAAPRASVPSTGAPSMSMTGSASAPASASPSPTPKPSQTQGASGRTKSSEPKKSTAKKHLTYTVKRGDNLTVIADWFKLHGYDRLYERNKKVIGSDPDLIVPGERITIYADGSMSSTR